MFSIELILLSTWLLACSTLAEIPPALVEFAQRTVLGGEIRYWGAFAAPQSTYHVFTLRQAERRGVFLVRQAGASFEVIGADTALDSFPREAGESDAAVRAAARLLNSDGDDPFATRIAAPVNDFCPLGASLNTFLVPITGFALSSNGTRGILRDLQHADACVVEPERAPPGSILVCPSQFAKQGPVFIGFVVVIGPDRCVYGPDYRQHGAWHRLATLREWLRANRSASEVRGFLLRAKQADRDQNSPPEPSPRQPS
jgi:hypothetical protein